MTRRKNLVTVDRLRELLDYDPETGVFRWKVERRKNVPVGLIAGSNFSRGYRRIVVDDQAYLSHRLAWLYVFECWPPDQIDHINGLRSDNRIANLRCASNGENRQNSKTGKNNSAGLKGVTRFDDKWWRARIQLNKRRVSLGLFETAELAYAAYCDAATTYHGQFAKVK